MKKRLIATAIISLSNLAAAIDTDKIYIGGGYSQDSFNGEDSKELSNHFFIGAPLELKLGEFNTALEATHIRFSDSEFCFGTFFREVCTTTENGTASGLSLVLTTNKSKKLNLFLRGGVLNGSDVIDSEQQFGGGAEYRLGKQLSARAEYFIAGDLETLAFSLKYQL